MWSSHSKTCTYWSIQNPEAADPISPAFNRKISIINSDRSYHLPSLSFCVSRLRPWGSSQFQAFICAWIGHRSDPLPRRTWCHHLQRTRKYWNRSILAPLFDLMSPWSSPLWYQIWLDYWESWPGTKIAQWIPDFCHHRQFKRGRSVRLGFRKQYQTMSLHMALRIYQQP